MHTFERGEYNFITVWKNEKFILTGKKFREINPLVIFLKKTRYFHVTFDKKV